MIDVATPPVERCSDADAVRVVARAQLLKVRQRWFFLIGSPIVIAFALIWIRSLIDADGGVEDATRFLIGAGVLAMVSSCCGGTTFDIGRARENGELELYSIHPCSRRAVAVGFLVAPVVFAVPPFLVVMLVGPGVLTVDVDVTLWLIPAFLLAAALFGALAVCLGLYFDPKVAGGIANLAPAVLIMTTPILFPADALPVGMRVVAQVLPTTHATTLMQQACSGGWDGSTWPYVASTLVATVLVTLLVVRMPGWGTRG